MFLHSGASLHGHEFSNRQSSGNQMHATQRLRSALASQTSPSRSITPTPMSSTERSTTPLPRRFSLQATGTPSRPDPLKNRPVSEISPRREPVVRFDEEPRVLSLVDPASEDDTFSDGFSDIASLDGAGQRRTRSRRTPKPASNFLLAYPPPRLRTKHRRFVQIRPRLLLQLQHLSADRRPKPSLDVLPARLLTGTHILPRLARRCPELFKLSGHLGLDDLVVARSEDFDAPDEDLDIKNLHQRDLVAVISPVAARRDGEKASSDLAEIALTDGSVWKASSFANGFEFCHTDAHGITKTARWVRKTPRQRASLGSPVAVGGSPSPPGDYKFTFSMIDPASRRHPIMATLTPSNLEVLDAYTIPRATSGGGRRATIRPLSMDETDETSPSDQDEKAARPVDEATRALIAITSIWVSLRHGQGWPTPNPSVASSVAANASSRVSNERRRSNTFPAGAADKPSPASPESQSSTTGSFPGLVPQRALSTGAAYMQRRQARLGHGHGHGHGQETTGTHLALIDSDDEPKAFDHKVLADAKKPGIYRRLRNWGHRITTHTRKTGFE